MRVNAKVSGLYKAINKIKEYETNKIQAVKDATNEAAINIQNKAKRRVPVDTGNLRSRIVIEPQKGDVSGMRLQVGTNVFYGPYIEFGTGIFAEHPTIPGRKTPWAFPVDRAGSGKKQYNWPIREVNGVPMYLTRGAKPHPFLFPSWEEERPQYIKALEEALRK